MRDAMLHFLNCHKLCNCIRGSVSNEKVGLSERRHRSQSFSAGDEENQCGRAARHSRPVDPENARAWAANLIGEISGCQRGATRHFAKPQR